MNADRGSDPSTRKPRDQAKCLSDIKAVADRLELPQPISDNACVMFKKWHNQISHHGHSLDAAIAACIYASARIGQVGIGVDAVWLAIMAASTFTGVMLYFAGVLL